ncbi:pickpocket protein 28-like, partial [Sitodiplosis mosellana]|uniref:pickpocket protein 28-like n=1 Tax=Sitodiplosis mosellana TaxID=263140 RepID=UPI002444F1D3
MVRYNCFKIDVRGKVQTLKKCTSQFVGVTWIFFREFTQNSNIHGLRYFSERGLHWSERLWWLVSLGLSLWLCGSMIHNSWSDWNENPLTFDSSNKAHISTIPFPTVTICPYIKTLKHKLDISSKLNSKFELIANLSDTESKQLNALAHICPLLPQRLKSKENFATESIYDTIKNLAPNLEYTIQSCSWKQKRINCSEFMSPILTSNGLCFQFNALNSRDIYTTEMAPSIMKHIDSHRNAPFWSLENEYNEGFIGKDYPMRVFSSGRENGLELILSTRTSDHDSRCSGFLKGFQIFLTSPGDLLKYNPHFRIQPSDDTLYVIKPRLRTSPKKLGKYQPKQRKCFFDFERRLRFFKSYSLQNCMDECTANFTMKKCGCVQFSMPRDKNTRICGASKINCYEEATT